MNKVLGFVVISLMSAVSHADIVCKADKVGFSEQPLTLTINDKEESAVVQIGDKAGVAKTIDHSIWDGHSAGMMTGKGFAFVYSNWFGCIRNATLITDLRPDGAAGNIDKVEFPVCASEQSTCSLSTLAQ